MENDKQPKIQWADTTESWKPMSPEEALKASGKTHFADDATLAHIEAQRQEIDRLNAENERLNAKGAQLREALLAIRSKDMSIWTMYINAEELCVKALASTDTTWLDRKLAEAKREMLEEAAKWFEEDGCTLLPSSVECAVELRRMGADLKG